MADERPRSGAPALVTIVLVGVAFVLLIAFAVLYVLHSGRHATATGLSSSEQAALDAGKQEIANLTTYSRAHFDADWQRAVNGTTGDLRTQQATKKTSTKTSLTTSKIDTRGEVSAGAVVSSKGDTVSLLVSLNGYQIVAGKSTLTSSNRLSVTVTRVKGKWLLSELQGVGLS